LRLAATKVLSMGKYQGYETTLESRAPLRSLPMKEEEILADMPQVERFSTQLNRNSSACGDETIGPFTIEAAESGLSGTANFNRTVCSVTAATITTRALTEISGSNSVPVGSSLRYGVGLKQGDVPAGASFSVIDGGGNPPVGSS